MGIEQAEKEFMEKYAQKSNVAGKEPQGKAEENDNRVEESLGSVNKHSSNIGTADSELTPEVGSAPKKKKKKHRSKDLEVAEEFAVKSSNVILTAEVPEVTLDVCVQKKKKKKKKHKSQHLDKVEEKAVKEEIVEISLSKKKKRKLNEGAEENFEE